MHPKAFFFSNLTSLGDVLINVSFCLVWVFILVSLLHLPIYQVSQDGCLWCSVLTKRNQIEVKVTLNYNLCARRS